jgi:lipoprotein-anchoring transpeptidase ErfK/SrfK
VSRQIDGWRDAPLGLLWRPKYFNGGIAVHGAHSIPPYAASHGCARLSVPAMNWIWRNDKMPIKARVWVY